MKRFVAICLFVVVFVATPALADTFCNDPTCQSYNVRAHTWDDCGGLDTNIIERVEVVWEDHAEVQDMLSDWTDSDLDDLGDHNDDHFDYDEDIAELVEEAKEELYDGDGPSWCTEWHMDEPTDDYIGSGLAHYIAGWEIFIYAPLSDEELNTVYHEFEESFDEYGRAIMEIAHAKGHAEKGHTAAESAESYMSDCEEEGCEYID